MGEWAGYRFYRARDLWIFLAGSGPGELDVLFNGLGLKAAQSDAANHTVFETIIHERPSADWVEILTKLNFGVMVTASIAQLRDRYLQIGGLQYTKADETYPFFRHSIDEASRWVDLFAPCAIRPVNGVVKAYPPADKYGASTRDVLKKLQFNETKITSLIGGKVAANE